MLEQIRKAIRMYIINSLTNSSMVNFCVKPLLALKCIYKTCSTLSLVFQARSIAQSWFQHWFVEKAANVGHRYIFAHNLYSDLNPTKKASEFGFCRQWILYCWISCHHVAKCRVLTSTFVHSFVSFTVLLQFYRQGLPFFKFCFIFLFYLNTRKNLRAFQLHGEQMQSFANPDPNTISGFSLYRGALVFCFRIY